MFKGRQCTPCREHQPTRKITALKHFSRVTIILTCNLMFDVRGQREPGIHIGTFVNMSVSPENKIKTGFMHLPQSKNKNVNNVCMLSGNPAHMNSE
jgi:hypothetical protein